MKRFIFPFVAVIAAYCSRNSGSSDLDFSSANLDTFHSLYDLKLKPRMLPARTGDQARVFHLDKSIYELRYFKIDYEVLGTGSDPKEGKIQKMTDIGGTGLPKDKMMDRMIPITTLLEDKIELPEGHYAAVICPRSPALSRRCLSDAVPLNVYKDQVQGDRCGRITKDGENIHTECKHILFDGGNTFLAIAYPLTVKRVEGNNRFVAGDLELSFLSPANSINLALTNSKPSQACEEAMRKASSEEGIDVSLVEGACADEAGAAGSASGGGSSGRDGPVPEGPFAPPPRNDADSGETGRQGGGNRGGGLLGDFLSGLFRNVGGGGASAPRGPQGGNGANAPIPRPFNFPFFPASGRANGDCFLAGTRILGVKAARFFGGSSTLVDLPVESIERGDYVFNPLTDTLVPVTERTSETLPEGKSIYRLGSSGVEVTGVHPILVPKGLTFVANFFSSIGDRSVSSSILYRTGTQLGFKQETIERRDPQGAFTVFNVRTNPSLQVARAWNAPNRSLLPAAFACQATNQSACNHFLAVRAADGSYLVAGDFIKQELLGEVMRGISTASYLGAVGKLP